MSTDNKVVLTFLEAKKLPEKMEMTTDVSSLSLDMQEVTIFGVVSIEKVSFTQTPFVINEERSYSPGVIVVDTARTEHLLPFIDFALVKEKIVHAWRVGVFADINLVPEQEENMKTPSYPKVFSKHPFCNLTGNTP